MGDTKKRHDWVEKSAYDIAETNVRGTIRKIQLEEIVEKEWVSRALEAMKKWELESSIADKIIDSFSEPEFAKNDEFSTEEIYKTLKGHWYFAAVKKQIWGLANHEMSSREVAVLNDILRSYIGRATKTTSSD